MESRTRLDYVLFHLTPTRTRCDLVIFAGNVNEKLAYGLLEPFISHLRSAKEQTSKGGYSVTLRPPSPENSWWFTKGTLQRFVRFVSTPEVLERFVTIEREISQLENSTKSFKSPNADAETDGNGTGSHSKASAMSLKSYGESKDRGDLEPEENSKDRLHRVVQARKVVLRKEQAMVYARALAAGFEMDNLNDLLLFSDAFGASRLREACINFRDLCNKKNEDRLWVDEIAAMQAITQPDLSFNGTSGVILTGDDSDPLTAGAPNGVADHSIPGSVNQFQTPEQMQHPWANQLAQHIRNFQGPMFQQMPPYQGYGFPGMQVAPHYPGNMNNSDNRESYDRHDRKSSSKRKSKASKARESQNEDDDDGSTEPSESSSETDSSSDKSHRKKHGKNSSRKVVIRNINYISSKRDGEKNTASVNNSDDQNGNKGSETWDAFQQLLLKEDTETSVPDKKSTAFMPDAFLVTERGAESYGGGRKISDENFEHNKGNQPVTRKGSTPEETLFSRRSDEQDSYARVSLSDNAARSSVINSRTSDDWFVSKQSGEATNRRQINGDFLPSSKDNAGNRVRDAVTDDSLMIQARAGYDGYSSQARTEIMGTTETAPQKVSESKSFYEPDELYMVLDRDTVVEQTVPSWNPQIDLENKASVNPAKKSDTDAGANLNANEKVPNKKSGASATKVSSRDARARTAGGPTRREKTEPPPPGPRRSTFGSKTSTPKSQFEKDEARKKRMEELLIRRQKRIAERGSDQPVKTSLSSDKLKRQSSTDEPKKPKTVIRSSTIDRLAVAKTPQAKREAPKLKSASAKSGSQKTSDVLPKKLNTNKINPSEKKPENKRVKEAKATVRIDAAKPPRENAYVEVDDSKDIKELHVTSLIIAKDVNTVVQTSASDKRELNPVEDHSIIADAVKKGVDGTSKKSVSFREEVIFSDDHNKMSPKLSIHPTPESPTKHLSVTNDIIRESPVTSVIQESTPPPTNGTTMLESTQLRKKWDGPENSSKAAKGFRKLLMFGRKSYNLQMA